MARVRELKYRDVLKTYAETREPLRNLPNILKDSLLENLDGLGARLATKPDLKDIVEPVEIEFDSRFKAMGARFGSFNSNNNGIGTSSSTNDRPIQPVAAG